MDTRTLGCMGFKKGDADYQIESLAHGEALDSRYR